MLDDRFAALCARYEELKTESEQEDVVTDIVRYRALQKELSDLKPAVDAWEAYQDLVKRRNEAQEMLDDPELGEFAREEEQSLSAELKESEEQLKRLLLPRDPDDGRNAVVEIRPGAGGDEAALFAAVLYRMYMRYAERAGMRFEPVSVSYTDLDGVKEAVFMLSGHNVFSRMKYESGVHRIQRVPVTEASGRIHTSTATVAVLPEAEEVEVELKPEEVRIDTYRASGHGGQYINRTDSAVRLTHLPTGLVVTCQDEKSQLKNKEKAFKVLSSRLYDLYRSQKDAAYADARRAKVGTGERNERIRTYNYREGRVTDHRIGMTVYNLDAVLDGELQPFIEALALQEQDEKLKNMET